MLCFLGSKRHAKANNTYLEDYDPSKPSNYIMHWDANSLYGGTMCEPLPYADLEFVDPCEEEFDKVINTSDDNEIGYIVTIDFVLDRKYMINSKSTHPLQKISNQILSGSVIFNNK